MKPLKGDTHNIITQIAFDPWLPKSTIGNMVESDRACA